MVFSFIKISYDEWLFISAAEIVDVPIGSREEVKIIEKFTPLFGRLVMRCKKGNKFRLYVFKMKNVIESCTVKEILPCKYSGDKFEGYDRVHIPYRKLDDIFNGKIMPIYYEALKKVTGVYCLIHKSTGKLYIGSATGEEGVAQRWGNYLDSKHGGNKELIALYKEKCVGYFEEHFTYTLIEYFVLSYDPAKTIEREQYWKMCFNTIQN